MSELSLSPEPVTLAIQAVVFLAGVGIVKTLILNPYQQLLDRRTSLTTGSKDEAVFLNKQVQTFREQIQSRMTMAFDELKLQTEAIRNKALGKRNDLLGASEKESKQFLKDMEKRLSSELTAERSKLDEHVKRLSEQLYQQSLS